MLTVLVTLLMSLTPAKASSSSTNYEDLSDETRSCLLVVARAMHTGEAALFCTSSTTEIAKEDISLLKYKIDIASGSESEAINELADAKIKIIRLLEDAGFLSENAKCKAPQLSDWKSQLSNKKDPRISTIQEHQTSVSTCTFQR